MANHCPTSSCSGTMRLSASGDELACEYRPEPIESSSMWACEISESLTSWAISSSCSGDSPLLSDTGTASEDTASAKVMAADADWEEERMTMKSRIPASVRWEKSRQ